MSRGYRARIPQAISQVMARAEDRVSLRLELLPILSPRELLGLLAEALAERGWAPNEAGQLERALGEVTARLEEGQISLTVARQAQVTARGQTAAEAQREAEALRARREETLRRRLSDALSRAERELRVEVEAALQGVYIRALKRRAAQLGEITSIQEREVGGEVELTIKVEV